MAGRWRRDLDKGFLGISSALNCTIPIRSIRTK